MYGERRREDVFYYLTVYNEPIEQPAEPADVDVDGHPARACTGTPPAPAAADGAEGADPGVRHRACSGRCEAQELLRRGLGRRGRRLVGDLLDRAAPRRPSSAEEHNLLHPDERAAGAVRDPGAGRTPRARSSRCRTGCGRCRTRSRRGCRATTPRWAPTGSACPTPARALRRHFHVDAESIVVAALSELARRGEVDAGGDREAIDRYQLADVTAAAPASARPPAPAPS